MPFQGCSPERNISGMTQQRRMLVFLCRKTKSLCWRFPDRLCSLVCRLLAQTQLCDQRGVTLGIAVLQSGQQAFTLIDHLQETTATVVIRHAGSASELEVHAEALPIRDLDFRRSGVVG